MIPNPEPSTATPQPPPHALSLTQDRAAARASQHPRTIGWVGTTALAIGGSNQSLFLLAALIGGQGSAAIPLLVVGLLLSWAAAPGWTELILMWPNRVGGIAAACSEAFRPYNPLLAALTGTCYWWGWVPTCGLTALLSAAAIQQWFVPFVSIKWLASGIVACFVAVNLCGIRWVVRLALPIAVISGGLALISALGPLVTGQVDWVQAASFHLETPFAGGFGALTSIMAGIYLIGFAAPAFEAAACHVGETTDPERNVPRAMLASALIASLYFVFLPVIWLGMFGPAPLMRDLAVVLGPTFAPVFGGGAKAVAIGFMVFNMFPGTVQPLAGASRTLSQLAEDGLLPRAMAMRNRADVPWVATVFTAAMSVFFLWLGDPVWLIAAANFTYLIGICMPSIAVWLLRRDAPDMARPYRAGRGMIGLGLFAALIWLISAIFGFEQFGISTVIIGLGFAYSGTALFAWRKFSDRRRAGLPGMKRTLHLTLTGSMLIVLALDAAGYQLAVSRLPRVDGPLVSGLEDIFVAVAMLTITVGLVLPGMIAHSVVEVSDAAKRLVSGTLLDFTQAMEALGEGNLAAAKVELEFIPVKVRSRDEIGEMASSFNELQREIQRSAIGLIDARERLTLTRKLLLDSNMELEERVRERSQLIDDLTAARDAAEAASVAKGGFVAKMSHEIRTPLNGILTTIDLLRNSDMSPAQWELMSIIERSGKTLLGLATDVLDYARYTGGKITADNVEFDLVDLVKSRFEEMTGQAAKSSIDFRLTLPADRRALHVVSDPAQFGRVLQNLLSNAQQFTEHGTVEVQFRVLGETTETIDAELIVSDTGIGMSDEFKLGIFEPFAQENESTTRTVGGAGLGLSIVKQIVDAWGGAITIDTQLGQGTAVRITWTMAMAAPAARESSREADQSGDQEAPQGANNQHMILVAEDNPINQEVIAASLTRLGQTFTIVDNGMAVLHALDAGQFSLVLMDCRMPIMDGTDAARAIRNREKEGNTGVRIPIVAISANTTQADRECCIACGMDDHIAKPFTLAELKQKLEMWLPTPPGPIGDSAPRPTATSGLSAPIFHLLDADVLWAFGNLQMPDQPSIVKELVDSFIRTAPQQLHLIESLVKANNKKGSIIAAHGMKSASAAIGLRALADQFRSIDNFLQMDNYDEAILSIQKTQYVLNKSLFELSLFIDYFVEFRSTDIEN